MVYNARKKEHPQFVRRADIPTSDGATMAAQHAVAYFEYIFRRFETMKTVMKKLLSIMLVALLLVSAVPFQAAAAEAIGYKYTIKRIRINYSYCSSGISRS